MIGEAPKWLQSKNIIMVEDSEHKERPKALLIGLKPEASEEEKSNFEKQMNLRLKNVSKVIVPEMAEPYYQWDGKIVDKAKKDGGNRFDAEEEEENNNGGGSHGNTRIPFGLCQREGIQIGKDWSPKDAWDALAGKGYSAAEVYKELQKTGKLSVGGAKPKPIDYDGAKKKYTEACEDFKNTPEASGIKAEKAELKRMKSHVEEYEGKIDIYEASLKAAEDRKDLINGRTMNEISDELWELMKKEKEYEEAEKYLLSSKYSGEFAEQIEDWIERVGGRENAEQMVEEALHGDEPISEKVYKTTRARDFLKKYGADGGVSYEEIRLSRAKSSLEWGKARVEKIERELAEHEKIYEEKTAKIEETRKEYAEAVKKKYPTFDDCKTEEEVRERLDCEGYFKEFQKVDFGTIGLQNSIETAKEIDGFFQKHQKLRGKLGRAVVVPIRNNYYGQSWPNGDVELNPLYYGDRERFNKSFERTVKSGYHPAGLTAKSVVYHEYTHQIDDYLTEVLDLPTYGKGGAKKKFSTVVFEEVRKTLKMKAKECKEAVSEYSWRNRSGGAVEWLAEAYSEFICSKSPRPVAMEVGKVVTRYLETL